MPYVKVELDKETAERLQDLAIAERRSTNWQAEVLIRQALGLIHPPSVLARPPQEFCHDKR